MSAEERLQKWAEKQHRFKLLYKEALIAFACNSPGEVRLAKDDSGLLYISKTQKRSDYADETVAWLASPREAVEKIEEIEANDDN